MTKQELEAENKRLREALLTIAHDTSDEEIKRIGQQWKEDGMYAYIVGMVKATTMHGLYGSDYLHADRAHKNEYREKAGKELKEHEASLKMQHPLK